MLLLQVSCEGSLELDLVSQWFSKVSTSESPGRQGEHTAVPHPRVSDSADQEWAPETAFPQMRSRCCCCCCRATLKTTTAVKEKRRGARWFSKCRKSNI